MYTEKYLELWCKIETLNLEFLRLFDQKSPVVVVTPASSDHNHGKNQRSQNKKCSQKEQ